MQPESESEVDSPAAAAAPTPDFPRDRLVIYGLVLITALAMYLRVQASLDDLWLDEIWQIQAVRDKSWPLGVMLDHPDLGNHILYALFIPPLASLNVSDVVYRLPGLLFAAASFPLLALVAWQQSRGRIVAVWLALLLFSGSFFAVQYAGEVRGYGMMMCFILLTLYAQWRLLHVDPFSKRDAVLLWLGIVLGSLSQILYLPFGLGPVGLWATATLLLDPATRAPRQLLRRFLHWYLAPGLALVGLLILLMGNLSQSGASESYWYRDLVRAYGVGLGNWPAFTGQALAAAAVLLTGLVACVIIGRRVGRGAALLYVLGILVMPLLAVLVSRPDFVSERYLIPSHLFWILALAVAGGLLWERRGLRPVLAVLALAVLGLNVWPITQLIRYGRGDYSGAVHYMAEQTTANPVIAGGDNDFRNHEMITYYRYALPPTKSLYYVPPEGWPAGGCHWYIIHSIKPNVEVPARIYDVNNNPFVLRRHMRHYGLSGWDWYLYQNERDVPESERPPGP